MPALSASPLPVVVPATLDIPAVPDILEEHLEELGYLSLRRRRQVFSTDVPLRRLREIDERIAAHWQGLVLGGPTSAQVALARIADADPWIMAAAVRVWLELGRPERSKLLEKLGEIDEPAWPAWREAFRQLPLAFLMSLASPDGVPAQPMPLRMLLVDAYAWKGNLPAAVAMVELRQAPPPVKVAVARHLGSLPKDPAWPILARQLVADPDAAVARAALWSLGLLDRPQALISLRAHLTGQALDPTRLLLCGIFGEPADAARLLAIRGAPAVVAAATRAVGELGGLDSLAPLVERLAATEPLVAVAAANALERIVGPLSSLDPSLADELAEVPPPPDTAAVGAEVKERMSRWPATGARLDGRTFPWDGPASEEPMAWVWCACTRGMRSDQEWMRKEIPDGVLAGEWARDTRPGE